MVWFITSIHGVTVDVVNNRTAVDAYLNTGKNYTAKLLKVQA
jgi:hypothetical protein